MESDRIYEESLQELSRVRASLSGDSVTINLSLLDENSKGAVITALRNSIAERSKVISGVLLRAKA